MKAVILAGGLGTRLRPFTQVIPKPLLPVGESSVLEIQLLSLKQHGVSQVFIATNHLSELVAAYIGDGSKYALKVEFSKEHEPLGTAGEVRGGHPAGRGEQEDVPPRIVIETTAKLVLVGGAEEDRHPVGPALANRVRERAPGEQRLDALACKLHEAEQHHGGQSSDQNCGSGAPRRQ